MVNKKIYGTKIQYNTNILKADPVSSVYDQYFESLQALSSLLALPALTTNQNVTKKMRGYEFLFSNQKKYRSLVVLNPAMCYKFHLY